MKYKIRLSCDPEARRYWLNQKEIFPAESQKVFNHSPDGFNHGYNGSGPAQLALAILLELTGNENLSLRKHQGFKEKYIAPLPKGYFDLSLDVEIL